MLRIPRHTVLCLVCLLASLAMPSFTQAQTPSKDPSRIDPSLFLYRHVLETKGPRAPLFGLKANLDPNMALVTLRYDRALEPSDVLALNELGGQFEVFDERGAPFGVGNVYRAKVAWDRLEQLYLLDGLVFAESMYQAIQMPSTGALGEEMGTNPAVRLPNTGMTGEGVLVVNIDNGIDLRHPAFFKADGEAFPWVDLDKNGEVGTVGTDGVDYNKNGTIEENEKLRLLDSVFASRISGTSSGNDQRFQANSDWLYIDVNQNGKRDAGIAGGFTETTPGYSEPTFVVDDVNKNGKLDPNERLIQLKTCKVSKLQGLQNKWERGVNLIESTTGENIAAFHGTATTGAVIGGQPQYHDHHGGAPEADLIMHSYPYGATDSAHAFRGIEDAVMSKANVILHEWTDPWAKPHDGSTNAEAAMDGAFEKGVAHANPVGNLNRAEKQILLPMSPSEDLKTEFVVGDGYTYSNGQKNAYSIVVLGLFWEGTQTPTLTVTTPGGESASYDLSTATFVASINNKTQIQATKLVTSKGNTYLSIYVATADQVSNLEQGNWEVKLTGITEQTDFHGRVTDYYSQWSKGVHWVNPTLNRGSIVSPSTADTAFGVAAYGGRDFNANDGSQKGELRNYSGRGPRSDGKEVIGIAAPDDGFLPIALSQASESQGLTSGWWAVLGGTSGAAPHAASALALLAQQDPNRSPQQNYDLLKNNADKPSVMGEVDVHAWGGGKLNVWRALYKTEIPDRGDRPEAVLKATVIGEPTEEQKLVLDATSSTDPEQGALEARFDFDHDGVFDTPWGTNLQFEAVVTDLEKNKPLLGRVEVRDELGNRHGALVEYTIKGEMTQMEPDPMVDMGAEQDMFMPSESDMGVVESDMFMPEQDMGSEFKEDMAKPSKADMQTGGGEQDLGGGWVVTPEGGSGQNSDDGGCNQAGGSKPLGPLGLILLGLAGAFGSRRRRR